MRRAASLLHTGTIVKEAAYALSYRNAAHFTTDFKKYFGVVPSRFVLVILAANRGDVAFRKEMSHLDKSNSFQVTPTVVE